MQVHKHVHSMSPRGARFGLSAGILISAAAFAACAGPTAGPVGSGGGSVSSSSSAGVGGAGGAGGAGGGAGDVGGGGTVCEPGATLDCYTGPKDSKDVGACKGGTQTCKPDGSAFGPCEGEILPATETCVTPDDDDCNGVANDMGVSCICKPSAVEACYTGPQETQGVGLCKPGTRTCNALGSEWSGCQDEVKPQAEICGNASDDDCNGASCAAPLWSLIYGGGTADQIGGMALDSTGNVYVAGTFSGTMKIGANVLPSAGGTDAYLAKFDPQGVLLWSQKFGDAADQGATGVAVDAADNVIATGYFNGVVVFGATTHTGIARDGFVAKFGPTGASLWSKKIGVNGNQSVVAVTTDAASSILVTGVFEGQLSCSFGCINSVGGQDIFVYKFSDTGSQTWLKTFGDPADQSPSALAVDSGGNVIVVGQFKGDAVDFGAGTVLGSAGGFDAFVVRLGPNGVPIWAKRYGDPLDQQALAVAVGPADGIAIAGSFQSAINLGALDLQSNGLSDIFIVKLTLDGTFEWDHSYGDPSEQTAQGIVFDASGGVFLTGGFQGVTDFGGGPITSLVSYDQFLLKLTDKGAHAWSRGFGDSSSQIGRNIVREASTGNIIVSAAASGVTDYDLGPLTSAGADDITLVKLSP